MKTRCLVKTISIAILLPKEKVSAVHQDYSLECDLDNFLKYIDRKDPCALSIRARRHINSPHRIRRACTALSLVLSPCGAHKDMYWIVSISQELFETGLAEDQGSTWQFRS